MSIAHQNAHTIIRDILSKQHIERVWFVAVSYTHLTLPTNSLV